MTHKYFHPALVMLVGLFLSHPLAAKEWIVDYNHSRLSFIGTQGSTPFEGEFKKFQISVDLDLEKPEAGKILAIIDVSSITAGNVERDSYLPQSEWFNTRAFPQSQFNSTNIHRTGPDTFVAEGQLIIKGIAQNVSLPFTLKQEGDHWHVQGRANLIRTDFHIGIGDWSNEDYVKHAVEIGINLSASPKN